MARLRLPLSTNVCITALRYFLPIFLIVALASTAARAQSSAPVDSRARLLATAFGEPLITTAPTSAAEDDAILLAIKSYGQQTDPDNLKVFETFLAEYPHSGYRVALLTNLGLSYYHYGYFSKAIDVWSQAWHEGKDLTEPHQKAMVDRAIGELIRMHARLGHADELQLLMDEVGTRGLTGPATEELDGAKEGLWAMRNDPGVAYLCGPMALKNLLLAQGAKPARVNFLDAYRSGPHGVTLQQVAELADQAKLDHTLVFRKPGQPVPVPSIVHWKLSHFAAVVGQNGDLFHIIDPTFGPDLWVSSRALDAESSGYFLVSSAAPTADFRLVTPDEARQVRGMGFTGNNWPFATTKFDTTCRECQEKEKSRSDGTISDTGVVNDTGTDRISIGLTAYKFAEMLVSLSLTDTPVGYAPPKGPPVYVTLTYNQREATQPSNFTFFNISPKWSLNWLSYVEDDPNQPGVNVVRAMAGGGGVQYDGYDSLTGNFNPEPWDASVLKLQSSDSPGSAVYTRQLPNGGSETYSQSDGATHFPRRIFLTQITDPAGNAVNLHYDSQLRLLSITDATGRNTTFSYNLPGSPLIVTDITDPFNRTAHLTYDAGGRLVKITDVIGMNSQFTYDASGLINALNTPYGTTTFVYGDAGNQRYLQATDPLNHTERVEYRQNAPGVPFQDPADLVPQGIIWPFNEYLNARDTFYWDEHAYAVAYPNYTLARNRHWTHLMGQTNLTADTVESIKFPYENRIWHNYPGQPDEGLGTAVSGTFNLPNRTGRVITDAPPNSTQGGGATRGTQLSQTTYNVFGHPIDIIDPVGRETQFTYAANQIDLLQVLQLAVPTSSVVVAQYTYNSQHLPVTYTDAAGQVTHYAYNSAGQLTQVTDALGETTSYQYDSLGYLTSITNPNHRTQASFTYDQYGHVATATDSEGYSVQYSYDGLDRITRETFPDATTRDYVWTVLDLTSAKDRQGRVTHYAYDAVRNLIEITDPLDRHTTFGYWENSKLKSLTDPNGNTTTWNIDLENRVTSKQYADGTATAYAYEGSINRLKAITDALGQSKQFTYGLDDTVAGISYLRAVNPTPDVTFTYDRFFRRVTSMTDGTGTTTYQYYPVQVLGALQLQQETGPFQNATIAYQYDKLGRLASRTVDSSVESFNYDDLGRIIADTNDLGRFNLGYLGETSQLTSRALQGSNLTTGWAYDTNQNDRRLKAINNSNATRSFNFTTTPEDLITQIAETELQGGQWPPQTWNYGYDNSNRLLQAMGSTTQYAYGYDPADNITSFEGPWGMRNASYNSVNEISSFNGHSYLYDANGNLLDDGVRHYQWDAENRLISIASDSQPGQMTMFRYDGLSRRISMLTGGMSPVGTNYLWCGDMLCQARDSSSDNVLRRYFSEGEYVLAGRQGLYYSQDQLGSVRDVLARDGSRTAASDYEPYGSVSQTANGNQTDFRYAGLVYDQQDDLYLSTYRAFDGVSGRFVNRDRVFENPRSSAYGYVGANPLNLLDTLGQGPQFPIIRNRPAGRIAEWIQSLFGYTPVTIVINGTPLYGLQPDDPNQVNCFGWTLAGGQVAVQPVDVQAYLTALRYRPVAGPARSGDLIVLVNGSAPEHIIAVNGSNSGQGTSCPNCSVEQKLNVGGQVYKGPYFVPYQYENDSIIVERRF